MSHRKPFFEHSDTVSNECMRKHFSFEIDEVGESRLLVYCYPARGIVQLFISNMSLYPTYKDCVWSSGCARAIEKAGQSLNDPTSQDAEPFRLEKQNKRIVYDESVILSNNRHGDLEYLENERLNEFYEE